MPIFKPRVTKHMVFHSESRRMRWARRGAYSTYGGRGEVFWWRNLRERDRLEEPNVNGKIF